MAFESPEAEEDERHLEGVEDYRGDAAGGGDVPYPPGGGDVESQESGVVEPPGAFDVIVGDYLFEAEKGRETHQGNESESGDQERNAGQQSEEGDEPPNRQAYFLLLFHTVSVLCKNSQNLF